VTDQRELEELRRRLVGVLWERLAELEADATREAIWRSTDWDLVGGDPCPRCGKPSLRFRDGVCLPCVADLAGKADRKERLRQRFLRFAKAHNARADKLNKRGLARAGPL
jgi:hypothetical protein